MPTYKRIYTPIVVARHFRAIKSIPAAELGLAGEELLGAVLKNGENYEGWLTPPSVSIAMSESEAIMTAAGVAYNLTIDNS